MNIHVIINSSGFLHSVVQTTKTTVAYYIMCIVCIMKITVTTIIVYHTPPDTHTYIKTTGCRIMTLSSRLTL